LNDRQRRAQLARDRILAFVASFDGSERAACDHFNALFSSGQLPGKLVWAHEHAWDKPRAGRRLNRDTLNKWKHVKKTRGSSAPLKIQEDLSIKPWYGLLLALRQRPQGSCLTWITGRIAEEWRVEWGAAPPSYGVVRRVLDKKVSAIDQLKGRYTGSQLRAHKHWKPRTAEGMYPWLEVHADGWNTHFTAPHPITGEYVTYEVWHYHDVATRYVPPPGIGLTETYEVITAGLERCVRMGGIPAVLQTDSTKVVKRSPRFTSDPFVALSERAGITVVHPQEVGNSQANGICENFNTWLDKQSRELATYQGKEMDSLTLKRVKKITAKMVKAASAGDLAERERLQRAAERTGKGRVFASYAEACAWINATCEKWNDKPHRSLPKITDPATGRQRRQTPREALQAHVEAGWQPVALGEEHLIDLFRPHVRCKVFREAISPVGNGQRYRFSGLGAWNGQEVMVAIDPMDWRAVWVKTLEGVFLGVADLVTASGYRAHTQYEIAEKKRAVGQLKRLETKTEHVNARTSLDVAVPASRQIDIAGKIIDVAALSASAPLPEPLRAQALPTMLPLLPRSERSAAENYAEWCDLQARQSRGEALSEIDARFIGSWPNSRQGGAHLKFLGLRRRVASAAT
jgi:putative transposase